MARDEAALADEELRAAAVLIAAGLPRVSVTRAYFAAFHMARALLYAHGHAAKSHEGVLHLVNLHWVKPGTLSIEQGRALARLQKYRDEADHGEAVTIDQAAAEEDLTAARSCCDQVRALLPSGVLP
jgi:uncharacterized protein (UPF0332 family)